VFYALGHNGPFEHALTHAMLSLSLCLCPFCSCCW
jgi:hypothetical protein